MYFEPEMKLQNKRLSIRTLQLFSVWKSQEKGIATVSANDKIVKAQDLLHYKQRVRAPPSSISRGRRPELTHKVAKVQVCPAWSNETISSDFMNVIADHNKNGAWNMLTQKKGESDLIKEIIWNFQVRWMVETLEGLSSVNIQIIRGLFWFKIK